MHIFRGLYRWQRDIILLIVEGRTMTDSCYFPCHYVSDWVVFYLQSYHIFLYISLYSKYNLCFILTVISFVLWRNVRYLWRSFLDLWLLNFTQLGSLLKVVSFEPLHVSWTFFFTYSCIYHCIWTNMTTWPLVSFCLGNIRKRGVLV